MILSAAHDDPYRPLDYGFTVDDFHKSYDQALGAHVTYGLKPYVTTRRNSALSQLILKNMAPVLSDLEHFPMTPQTSDPISFKVTILDDHYVQAVQLFCYIDNSWQLIDLLDDGIHDDGQAGDNIYGNILPALNQSTSISYYISARDDSNAVSTLPAGAPQNVNEIKIGYAQVALYINEFLTSNITDSVDESGDHEDWIEIYNGGSGNISLNGLYLSDNFNNPAKWALPDTVLLPGEFLLVWADEEGSEGSLHANFKLDKDGERIGIFNSDFAGRAPIDTLSFNLQTADVSYGRSTDGSVPWEFFNNTTPGQSNTTTGINPAVQNLVNHYFVLQQNYPNPFNPSTTIRIEIFVPGSLRINICDLNGKTVKQLQQFYGSPGYYEWIWDGHNNEGKQVASGLYFLNAVLRAGNQTISTCPVMKIVLLR